MSYMSARVSSYINRSFGRISMLTGLNLNRPSYICAKMTMRCNSRCLHCDIWKIDYAVQELSTEQWLTTLERLRGWLGTFPMVFTGGEALLRPDMIVILEHAVRLGIKVELLTNGLFVDEDLARRIVTSGIAQVTLSYDGSTPETHDRFRGETGFHKRTYRAIAALTHHREVLKQPLKILLKTVISRNNLAELVEIARFAQAGGFHVRYQPIEENYAGASDTEWFQKSELWVNDLPLLRAQITELKTLQVAGALIDNQPAELDSYISYFEHPDTMMAAVKAQDIKRWSKSCGAALSNFVISENGDVRMCYMMDSIGNIAITTASEIWRNRKHCWSVPCNFR